MWSAMQTLGLSGKTWFPRVRCIGNIYATCLLLVYAAVVLSFAILGRGLFVCC